MNNRILPAVIAGLLLIATASCTSTSVTQTSRNSALISTSAAPACGTQGAIAVANQSAAIATLKQGFTRFIIVGGGTQNNTHMVTTGPTFATTTGTFHTNGGYGYGTANTIYGGQTTYVAGSHEAQMQVVMFNPGDKGFEDALDAKTVLGPEWQKKLVKGINNCF